MKYKIKYYGTMKGWDYNGEVVLEAADMSEAIVAFNRRHRDFFIQSVEEY